MMLMFCCGGAHDATRRRSSKAHALQLLRRTPISTPARSLLNCRSLMPHLKRQLPRACTMCSVCGSQRQAAAPKACIGGVTTEGKGAGSTTSTTIIIFIIFLLLIIIIDIIIIIIIIMIIINYWYLQNFS